MYRIKKAAQEVGKTALIAIMAVFIAGAVNAQDKKVAVFDPVGSVENSLKEIVREEVSSIIVNAGGYTVLERQLINKVLEENQFQMGGLVDDAQIVEMGKLMGANLAFVSNITPMGTNYYISCKMIDIQSGRVEMQKTAQTQRGMNDLIGIVQTMAREMFGQMGKSQQMFTTQLVAGFITADKGKVYQGGRRLSPNEVQFLMANTDAMRLYNNGRSQYKNGGTMQIIGSATFV